MIVKSVKIKDLKKSPYNPRTISFAEREGLKYSIDKFGLVQPIIVNKKTGNVVGGNQRLDILTEQGIDETTVIEVDLSLDDEKELNIALNTTTIQGKFNKDIIDLINEIKEKNVESFDNLRLFELKDLDFSSKDVADEFETNQELIKRMELQPYESYDYIIIFYKNSMDYLYALNKLNITKVNAMPSGTKGNKIGVGRVLDGEKFNEILGKLPGKSES